MLKPDQIELASREERIEFILQELACNPDIAGTDNMDTAVTFFSHMYNLRLSKREWESTVWPQYLQNKNGPIVEPLSS
jgi:imidazoleglycerol phosphate dehydratase HisB